jgi:oligopeptide transport system permease protein
MTTVMRSIGMRLTQSIMLMYAVATAVFLIMSAVPGGPFSEERNLPESIRIQIESQYGLGDPLPVQYLRFIKGITPKSFKWKQLCQWDWEQGLGINLGHSYRYEGRTVNELIKNAFPVSLQLGSTALLIALITGLPAAWTAAIHPNLWVDRLLMLIALLLICTPAFVLGPMLQYFFGFAMPEALRLPVLFWDPQASDPGWSETLSQRILPCITLAAFYAAGIFRLARQATKETLQQSYIRSAIAKGVHGKRLLFGHILQPSLMPVIAYAGPVAAHLITGSFIVETLFLIPGMGRHLVHAALNRDYTLIMGCVLLYAAILILFNLMADLALILINPRLRKNLQSRIPQSA